jgi:hypothetical protein
MVRLSFQKHDLLSLPDLDDAVHEIQLYALEKGMIPIAAIISRPLADGRHEVLGFGHNELADGIPGVHGETGAVKGMGRIVGGYSDLVATSSLSPCPFCQCTLVRQLGIKTVRILDDLNYRPDKSDYEKAGITPIVQAHPKTVYPIAPSSISLEVTSSRSTFSAIIVTSFTLDKIIFFLLLIPQLINSVVTGCDLVIEGDSHYYVKGKRDRER